jgi:hypothetical protein
MLQDRLEKELPSSPLARLGSSIDFHRESDKQTKSHGSNICIHLTNKINKEKINKNQWTVLFFVTKKYKFNLKIDRLF